MLVIIESPYAGDVERNLTYARRAVRDSIERGESPFASHLLYTQPGVLQDSDPKERALGIRCGLSWALVSDLVVFYTDYGWSPGMKAAQKHYDDMDFPYTERKIGKNPGGEI